MRVKAIRDHFHAGEYRKEGEEFELSGKPHENVKPLGKEKASADKPGDEATGDPGAPE